MPAAMSSEWTSAARVSAGEATSGGAPESRRYSLIASRNAASSPSSTTPGSQVATGSRGGGGGGGATPVPSTVSVAVSCSIASSLSVTVSVSG